MAEGTGAVGDKAGANMQKVPRPPLRVDVTTVSRFQPLIRLRVQETSMLVLFA